MARGARGLFGERAGTLHGPGRGRPIDSISESAQGMICDGSTWVPYTDEKTRHCRELRRNNLIPGIIGTDLGGRNCATFWYWHPAFAGFRHITCCSESASEASWPPGQSVLQQPLRKSLLRGAAKRRAGCLDLLAHKGLGFLLTRLIFAPRQEACGRLVVDLVVARYAAVTLF